MSATSSAIYEGHVTHRRHLPRRHEFTFPLAQLFLDLDEIEGLFRKRLLWSSKGRNLAEWRREDYLGPGHLGLREAVMARVEEACGLRPDGPIRMLCHPRYAGYVFNPVTFYYCHGGPAGALQAIVADITNTPWKERHAYVLPLEGAERRGRSWAWQFDKTFHVSPFMGMERHYDWRFTTPGEDLHVHMKAWQGENSEFDATLWLRRRPLDGRQLARLLWRYPLMTAQVFGAIHWQALRLWLKGVPVHTHPDAGVRGFGTAGEERG
ncbi:DUF1365 domain-containing protein [Lysobacter sp. SG-8]|uniref:DUF1365 domain-containing protein n=1 Tax=Marilutibacter penaei TaxID=2759900 RepID=A0A7W3U3T3_9GAMM|nr:DUF1365 domain-containing protein [Lysobacter penaei]MBB1088416.1 DUF1365 domain-containing protein [Lysobacter penaei]